MRVLHTVYTLLDTLLYVVILKNEGNTFINYRLSHKAHSEHNRVAQNTANYFKERRKEDVINLDVC